ncbi:MAG TPA: hypothetical protein VFV87_05910, partial [Pirellulaceae bacterium]|nr:hypothetical protein [Pirellulaceae bacterium]
MNRSLIVPACCSLLAFTALLAALHGVLARETGQPQTAGGQANRERNPTELAYSSVAVPRLQGERL